MPHDVAYPSPFLLGPLGNRHPGTVLATAHCCLDEDVSVRSRFAVLLPALLLSALTGCTELTPASSVDREDIDTVAAPELGACRLLDVEDIEQSSNASEVVDCAGTHTAETFTVGTFPKRLAKNAGPNGPALGAFAFGECSERFLRFVGGEESSVLRSTLTWAWFRPSDEAWEKGARWYRCDVVGGGATSGDLVALPKTAKGLLLGRPDDRWMVCANAPDVVGAPKIPCSEPHNWRAISTVVLGDAKDRYPGDRLVEVQTRDYCSDQVGAWLNYPVDYDYGYTYFHEAEWKTGNRRSICWAKTRQ